LGYVALLACGVGLWFTLVYGGAERLTAWRTRRVRLYLDAELGVPFVPATVLLYDSVYLHYVVTPFVLRRRREVRALAATLAAATLCAGVGFLLFPAHAEFSTPQDLGPWNGLVQFTKRLAGRHNLAPSLHVALAVVCTRVLAARAQGLGKALLWTWAAGIAASTLLLHQHYLIDVVSGFALGWLGVRWGYRRWVAAAS
jgi:membrane-associated phospholipid phosphatase